MSWGARDMKVNFRVSEISFSPFVRSFSTEFFAPFELKHRPRSNIEVSLSLLFGEDVPLIIWTAFFLTFFTLFLVLF